MGCNWELYELKLIVWVKGTKAPTRGFAGLGVTFYSVTLDFHTLGISGFQGNNNHCDFKSVFGELKRMKFIPFMIGKGGPAHYDPMSHFGRLQTAEKNKEKLPAAMLYVHMRRQEDMTSQTTGLGVLLEGVTVGFTATSQGGAYAHLFGDTASTRNF